MVRALRTLGASLFAITSLCSVDVRAADVEWGLRVLNRINVVRNGIQTQLLFDGTADRFRLEDYLLPVVDQVFSTHLLGASLDVSFSRSVAFTLAGDTGLLRVGEQNVIDVITVNLGGRSLRWSVPTTRGETKLTSNGVPLADEARRSLLLRESYFTFSHDSGWRVAVGKQRVTFAEGWIYDQFALGAVVRFGGDGGARARSRWTFDLDAILADGSFDSGGKSSPLVHAGLRYSLGPFQSLGLSLLYFHDGDDLLSEIFRTAVVEANLERKELGLPNRGRAGLLKVPFSSGGDLFWFGVSGRKFFGDHRLTFALFGQAGESSLRVVLPPLQAGDPPTVRAASASMPGLLADVAYQYDATEDLAFGAFFTFASGDDRSDPTQRAADRTGIFGTFVSIFPFVSRTNLFFQGGLNAESSQRRASTLGVNARGLIVGGAFARWDGKHARLEARIAALGAHASSLNDGRYYGTELDLNARLPLGAGFAFVLEVDTLWTGPFFSAERPMFQAIAGFDLALPY
jgi:hypothetical protein